MGNFCVYSDDSGSEDKRYQSLSVVSGDDSVLQGIRKELRDALLSNRVEELKFEWVNGHSPKMKCAAKFVELAVSKARNMAIRIDTITWDIKDSRHQVQGRDDTANMGRMYYKVLRHMGQCWKQRDWDFFPDEQSGINWQSIKTYLNSTRLNRPKPAIFHLFDEERIFFAFRSVEPTKSLKEPLIQLADLFAGLSRFSREKGQAFCLWVSSEDAKKYPGLFELPEKETSNDSKRDTARFTLLRKFDELCKKEKLYVSIKTNGYLCTHKPTMPINFWNYEPQSDVDKAPTD